jgi:hypothetical protein
VALFTFLARFSVQYPALALPFAIPNAGKRDGRQGADMVAEGLRAGVWDIFVPAPHFIGDPSRALLLQWQHGLFIEMKAPGKKPSPEQEAFRSLVEPRGYRFVVCHCWVEAAREILAYLGIEDADMNRQLWLNTKGTGD